MNKFSIVALVLLLAGIAMVLNSSGILCPFAGDSSSCKVNGNCNGNCVDNGICPNGATCAQINSTKENCSALGSCPVKAAGTGTGTGCCSGR